MRTSIAVDDALLGVEPLAIGGLILTEVLQGFQPQSAFAFEETVAKPSPLRLPAATTSYAP